MRVESVPLALLEEYLLRRTCEHSRRKEIWTICTTSIEELLIYQCYIVLSSKYCWVAYL